MLRTAAARVDRLALENMQHQVQTWFHAMPKMKMPLDRIGAPTGVQSAFDRLSMETVALLNRNADGSSTYKVVPMRSKWFGEQFNFPAGKIEYLNSAALPSLRLELRGGLIYQNGRLFTCQNCIYVMDRDGTLYAVNGNLNYKHSSFFQGLPVAGAGTIQADDGRLTYLNGRSGHYVPNVQITKQVLRQLARHGIEVDTLSGQFEWQ